MRSGVSRAMEWNNESHQLSKVSSKVAYRLIFIVACKPVAQASALGG
jgi:hypothetical protein